MLEMAAHLPQGSPSPLLHGDLVVLSNLPEKYSWRLVLEGMGEVRDLILLLLLVLHILTPGNGTCSQEETTGGGRGTPETAAQDGAAEEAGGGEEGDGQDL